MKLNAIDSAIDIEDLRLPASNRLEALKGGAERGSGVSGSMIAGVSDLNGKAGIQKGSKLSTIVKERVMKMAKIAPVHPGIYLKELLDDLGISQYRLAKDLRVPAMRINDVVNGRPPITAELALRLGLYFGQNPRYWLNLQAR